MGGVPHGTLLDIPLLRERRGSSLLGSVAIHVFAVILVIVAPYVLPSPQAIQIGSGPGGGTGGESYSVGVADELAGGVGMTKPSLIPQPPVLLEEKTPKEKPAKEAVQIPDTVEPKKIRPQKQQEKAAKKETPPAQSNVIPTAPQPGAGGTGGISGGSGGGRGGGSGVSIGTGSGGWGDSWYARTVESRIGSNWIKPVNVTQRVEIIYSFIVGAEGNIYDIRKVKSSGNEALDLTAERAIRASNPLSPPPPELRGRPLEFAAQFVYPPYP